MSRSDLLVKICGLTRPEDAEAAIDLGAGLLGLNFWPRSPRWVDEGAARELVAVAAGRVAVVGVFVDQPVAQLAAAVALGVDLVQLHGDESPEVAAELGDRAIKVFRVDATFDRTSIEPFSSVWGFLVEGRHLGYGGTGRGWPYELVRGLGTTKPVLVAGGVRPGNVGRVISACDPTGIDVCSGVESAPGIKDRSKMEALFEEIRDGEDGQS